MNYLVILIGLLPLAWAVDTTTDPNADVRIRFYYGINLMEFQEYNLRTEVQLIKDDPRFNQTKPCVIYIHGFMQSPDSNSVRNVTLAFLDNGSYNVLVLNYTQLAANYVNAYLNRGVVSQLIVQAIDNYLFNASSYPMSRFYLVGHSLGAQIAGQVGNSVQKGNISRITGLDPAGPGFFYAANMAIVTTEDLRANSAIFVDVIHTDAGIYGYFNTTGDADFWPNGGKRYQPGCPTNFSVPLSQDDLCSHIRSWVLFVESMRNASAFCAWNATNYADFQQKSTSYTAASSVPMGYPANPSNLGNFYLYTNAAPPYGKGSNGNVK